MRIQTDSGSDQSGLLGHVSDLPIGLFHWDTINIGFGLLGFNALATNIGRVMV